MIDLVVDIIGWIFGLASVILVIDLLFDMASILFKAAKEAVHLNRLGRQKRAELIVQQVQRANARPDR